MTTSAPRPHASRALRFCFPTTFYPPYNFGGDGINVQRLARALVGRGHHVTVIHDVDAYNTLAGRGRDVTPAEADGVDVISLKSRLGPLSPLLTQQTGHPVANHRRLRGAIESGRFDVINYHNVSLLGGPGLLAYGSNVVKLYTAHEHWLVCPTHVLWRHRKEPCPARQCLRCQLVYRRPPQLWRNAGVLEKYLHHVDEFIAFSEFSRLKHREFGFPRDMRVLPGFTAVHNAEARVIGPSPNARPYFLFVGRLERIKGLDDVISVFRDYPDADLLIAGEGKHMPRLTELAHGAANVRFLGRVPFDELGTYYRHAIATVVPSVAYETFGAVVIESLAHGTPVIGRDRGGVAETVRLSGGGDLFTTGSDLRESMIRFQRDVAHRELRAAAGSTAYTEHWSEDAVLGKYLELVFEVLNRRKDCARS